MQNSGIASLHSGLIERARPSTREPVGILKLRAAVAPPPKVSGPVELPHVQTLKPRPLLPSTTPKRYGLTLRVDPRMRRDLAEFTSQTGRTVQNVLHAALAGYLDRAKIAMQHKE